MDHHITITVGQADGPAYYSTPYTIRCNAGEIRPLESYSTQDLLDELRRRFYAGETLETYPE